MNNRRAKLIKKLDRALTRTGVDQYEHVIRPAYNPFVAGKPNEERTLNGPQGVRFTHKVKDWKTPHNTGEYAPINHKRRMRKLAQRRQLPLTVGIDVYIGEMREAQRLRDEKAATAKADSAPTTPAKKTKKK